jgi:hypothetical protein
MIISYYQVELGFLYFSRAHEKALMTYNVYFCCCSTSCNVFIRWISSLIQSIKMMGLLNLGPVAKGM